MMRCEKDKQVLHIHANRDELAVLSNALSEVTYGFQRPDFDGTPSHDALRLLRHLSDVFDASSEDQVVHVGADMIESQLLIGALKAGMAEFGSSEFHTRIGCTVDKAKLMLSCLECS